MSNIQVLPGNLVHWSAGGFRYAQAKAPTAAPHAAHHREGLKAAFELLQRRAMLVQSGIARSIHRICASKRRLVLEQLVQDHGK